MTFSLGFSHVSLEIEKFVYVDAEHNRQFKKQKTKR
eukprot:UN25547